MKRQIRAAGRRFAERVAPTAMTSVSEVPELRQQVGRLRRELEKARQRITSLEEEIQESRRLNRRVAEITDVVQEVLLPAADRDDERLRRVLDGYVDGSVRTP